VLSEAGSAAQLEDYISYVLYQKIWIELNPFSAWQRKKKSHSYTLRRNRLRWHNEHSKYDRRRRSSWREQNVRILDKMRSKHNDHSIKQQNMEAREINLHWNVNVHTQGITSTNISSAATVSMNIMTLYLSCTQQLIHTRVQSLDDSVTQSIANSPQEY